VSATNPLAVLWDLDGTIIDSEPYWLLSEQRLVEEFGGTWSEADGFALIGAGLSNAAEHLQGFGVDMLVDAIVRRMVDEVDEMNAKQIPWRPGALELLRSIHDAGIPQVIVTMSYRTTANFIADELGLFAGVICGEDVTHSKPHPEPYQMGAALVGADPRECVALEDSVPGSASAVAAGAVTIALPLHVPLPESENYTIWHTMVGRDMSHIREVFAEARA
jgi:HAD superfamily hydrolase (TIGR01509 family)